MLISNQHNKRNFVAIWGQIWTIDAPVQVEKLESGSHFVFNPSRFRDKDKRDAIRNVIKNCDSNYPRHEDGSPKSYRELTRIEINTHLEWLESEMAHSGYEWK